MTQDTTETPADATLDYTSPGTRVGRIREIVTELLPLLRHGALERAGLEADANVPSRFRKALQSLGVTFVKLGQTLSTRPDLLGPSWIEELSQLKCEVEPMPWPVVEQRLLEAYGAPWGTVFQSFEHTPVGAASIGQVHIARLLDGTRVAVKVQRDGALAQVEQDLALLQNLGGTLEDLTHLGDVVPLREIIANFAATLLLELDYRVESRNLQRIQVILKSTPDLHVPRPFPEHTRKTVLVMELVEGLPLHRVMAPEHPELARAVCNAYLDQIVDAGFFHADPHPGNFLLAANGRLTLIDLGMVEVLDAQERAGVAQLVLGLARGSAVVATEALQQLSEPGHDADPAALRRLVAQAVRQSVALRGIEPTFGTTTYALLRALMACGYRPIPQLASVARTLAMLDEVLQLLDPELDPASVVEARAGEMAWSSVFEGLSGSQLAARGLDVSQLATRGPRQAMQLLEQLATGTFRVQVDAFDEERTFDNMRKIGNRIAGALIVAALLMSGALIDNGASGQVAGLSYHALILLLLGGGGAVTLLSSILIFDR